MTTWKERFEKKFHHMTGCSLRDFGGKCTCHQDDFKSFIAQELQKQKKEIVKMIRKEQVRVSDGTYDAKTVLDDIIKKIGGK